MNKFPKKIEKLSKKRKIISDSFIKLWHLELKNKKFSLIENFNHNYVARSKIILKKKGGGLRIKTLEIGAGIGNHLYYEELKHQDYYCIEILNNMIMEIKKKFPQVTCIKGDIQKKTNFDNNYFDRIHAIHTLEHLPNLPRCIKEVYRLIKPSGIFQIVIPCDPGFLYSIARKVSAERIFKKKFKMDYKWFIEREHINTPEEILFLIKEKFKIIDKKYFPFLIPSINFNLCLGLTLKPLKN
jgi:ubiquinone/menaquinone biosynthesis C-methylase UbiE